jgi:hypothetical protein
LRHEAKNIQPPSTWFPASSFQPIACEHLH